MDAATKSNFVAAQIMLGRVIDVNVAKYTCSVAPEFGAGNAQIQTDISFATPYQHFYNGEGIYFMPEVGSVCWLCFPSDHNRPFILGWGSPNEDSGNGSNFRSRKRDLNPGDIYLGTRDENFIYLRRGGVVQIGATPLAQRMFLPLGNWIKDFCENFGLYVLGGDLEWTIARSEKTVDGQRPALLKLRAKEFASDKNAIAELEIGSHGESDPTILTLRIKASGSDGAAAKFSLKIDKTGKTVWEVEETVSWDVKGEWVVTAAGGISFSSKTQFEAEAPVAKLHGTVSAELSSDGAVTLSAPQIAIGAAGGAVALGGGVGGPATRAVPLLTWLAGHTHMGSPPGTPTSPPIVPPDPSIASLNVTL